MAGTAARWIAAWPGGAAIGVVNGVARETTYGRLIGERAAGRVSEVTFVAAFAAYFRHLDRRWPLRTRREAVEVGAVWAALTVGFEFAFGRLVAKDSWEELLAAYDVRAGSTWPLLVAWIAGGPEVTRRALPRP